VINSTDLRKLVSDTSDTISKDDVTTLITKIGAMPMPAPQRRAALEALSAAYIAIAKGDTSIALEHVQKARAAVRRATLAKGR
jgi:hypothetical protein